MANDKNKKVNSNKTTMKKSVVTGSCKPCMPIERSTTNKEKSTTTKNPSATEISNVTSCYKKCASSKVQEVSSSTPNETAKPAVETLDRTTVGSCYAKCGPPSVQQNSTSTPSGSAVTTSKPDQVKSQTRQEDSTDGSCKIKPLSTTNPFIEKMDEDILYHIALGNKSHDLVNMFGDVKFVVMGSTPKRMEQFAYFMATQLKHELPPGTILNDISKNSHRYAMFKVGPILSVSHGMGTPSIGILLHELIKLMSHAGVKNPTFLRIGTCGGFNKKAGTVVVSNKVVNDFMESFYELAILGKKIRFPANLDQTVVQEILSSSEQGDKFETIAGATYCTDNFYEGSGRADGAICEFSQQEGLNYYKEIQQNGVVNVEMESLAFAAFTCRAGIKSAIVTVILSDRLETDQIKQSKEILDEWQSRPQRLLANYIKKKLSFNDLPGSTNSSISTSKIPTSSFTTEGTICKSCGGTVSSTNTRSTENTTSVIPTMATRPYSTTYSNTTRCESCGGSGIHTNATTNKSDNSTSTTPSSGTNTVTGKSCGWFGKNTPQSSTDTGGTSSVKPITPMTPSTCKSCGGTGVQMQLSTGTSTMKPTDTAYSTTTGSMSSKPGESANKTTDYSTTKKSADFTPSTTSSGSTICKACLGTGKDEPEKDGTKPSSCHFSGTSLVPKCTGSKFDSSPGTMKPTTAPCKSCMGSGKTNDSNTAMQSTISTTGSPDMVKCECCGGAGIVPSTKTNDEMIPTVKPFFAPGSTQSNSVCKPCLKLPNEDNLTVPSSTAAPKSCTPGGSASKPSSSEITTSAPSLSESGKNSTSTTTSGSTTSVPNVGGSNVCKPCLGIGSSTTVPGSITSVQPQRTTPMTNNTSTGTLLESTTKGPASVCKPCVGSTTLGTTGGSTTLKPTGAETTLGTTGSTTTLKPTDAGSISKSNSSAPGVVCKPCVGSSNLGTTSGTTTGTPNHTTTTSGNTTSTSGGTTSVSGSTTTTSQPSFSIDCLRKKNAGSTTSSTITNSTSTVKPGIGNTTTASQSGLSSEGPYKQNGGRTTSDTTGGTSTCKPGSNPPTSQSAYSTGGVCKPCGGSTTPGTAEVATTSTPSSTSATARSSFSIEGLCKRNGRNTTSGTTGGTSTCKPGNNPPTSQYGGSSGMSTDRPRDLTTNTPDNTTTTRDTSPFGVCKPCSGGGMIETTRGTTTTPASGLAGASKSTSRTESTTENNRNSTPAHEILKNTCKPSVNAALDVTKSTTSQPTANYSTSKKNLDAASNETGTSTTEPKRPKCVPYTCYTADKTDTTPLPTTPKAYLAKDFDSSSNSTISNDSWRSCYQKCSSRAPSSEGGTLSTSKPLTFQTPEQDNMKGVPPAVGPCCTSSDNIEFREVPNAKGPGCASCEKPKDSNAGPVKTKSSMESNASLSQINTESSLERRPSMGQVKTESPMDKGQVKPESSMDRRPSMGHIKAKSLLEKHPSFGSTTPSNDNQTVDSKSGPCCTGRSNGVTSRPVSSKGNVLGPCCSGKSTQPQDVTSSRPEQPQTVTSSGPVGSKSVGGLCSRNTDDSPDEPCSTRKSNGEIDEKCLRGLSSENVREDLNETRGGSKESQSTSKSETDSKSVASGQPVGNIQGCPISISGPCVYKKDDAKTQGLSTPKPSPDTPDPATIRTMPAFVTPTPPSSKGIICYSKFTNNNGVLVTSSVNKEANKYDESPSPCAACKKFQENEASIGSTPADSQPEIIRCPHKLKRLKDECQGYD